MSPAPTHPAAVPLDALPAAALLLDGQGVVRAVNRRATLLFGLQATELIGRTLSALIVLRDGQPVGQRGDGSEFPVHIQVDPEAQDNGRVALLQDLTETLRAQQRSRDEVRKHSAAELAAVRNELLDEQQLLARFFTLSLDLICIANLDGYFERINPAFSVLGYDEDELLSRPFLDFVHPDDVEATRAEVSKLARRGTTLRFENRYRCQDGSYRWFSWTAATGPSGKIYAVGHDVTERRLERESLSQANLFLDAIIENIPSMVFVKDAERLEFVRFNRAGEELLGAPRSALLGKNDYDFFPADEAEFFQRKDRETLADKTLVDIPEEPIQTASGIRILHTMKVPLLDANGRPSHLLGISQDITEAKELQRELQRSKEKLEQSNRELEAFSYSVAHDLRSPLRSIDGFAQALLEDYPQVLDAAGKRFLNHIRESAQLMARLIDDLLTLSQVSRSELRPENVDVTHAVEGAVRRLRRNEPNRLVEVSVQEGLRAHTDMRMLNVVLDNLIGNAWKFTSKCAHPRIEFGTRDRATYFVRDNGAGFDMAYSSKLFGVFQRLHPASEFEGTGVGLAIVKRIVTRLGGAVWAESEPERGATFFFTLNSEVPDGEGK